LINGFDVITALSVLTGKTIRSRIASHPLRMTHHVQWPVSYSIARYCFTKQEISAREIRKSQ
jgi:hypothetical protein